MICFGNLNIIENMFGEPVKDRTLITICELVSLFWFYTVVGNVNLAGPN